MYDTMDMTMNRSGMDVWHDMAVWSSIGVWHGILEEINILIIWEISLKKQKS